MHPPRLSTKRKVTCVDKLEQTGSKKKKPQVSQAVRSTTTSSSAATNSRHLSHLKFLTAAQRKKYDVFASRGVIPNRYADTHALEKTGLLAEVTELLQEIGWKQLLALNSPTYAELVYEFLSTFEFDDLDSDTREEKQLSFHFRLMGKAYELTEEDLRQIFGWKGILHFGLPVFDEKEFWKTLTMNESEEYSGRCSKASKIVNPSYRYIYKLFAYSFFGRGSIGMVSKLELAILYCVDQGKYVDFVPLLGRRIKEVISQDGPIVIGCFVTMFARHLEILDRCAPNLTIYPGKFLDLPSLVTMRFLRRSGEHYEIIPSEQGSRSLVLTMPAMEAQDDGVIPGVSDDESLRSRVDGLESSLQELKTDVGVIRTEIANQQDLLARMFDYMKFHFPQPPLR